MQGKMYVKNFKKNTMYLPMLLKTEHLPTSMKPSVSHPDCFSLRHNHYLLVHFCFFPFKSDSQISGFKKDTSILPVVILTNIK